MRQILQWQYHLKQYPFHASLPRTYHAALPVTMARTVSWYDNEYGFTCNMVRTLLYFAEISE